MTSSGASAVFSAARRNPKYTNKIDNDIEPEAIKQRGHTKRRVFSQRLYGTVIEEVDPFVFEDTFCVISKKFNKSYVFRFSCSRSLFIFGPMNPLRRLCVYIITHQVFDLFIISAIVGNCIALGFDNNLLELDDDSGLWYTQDYRLSPWVEWGFLTIYTLEMMFKVISKGFILNKFSYLRNAWNCLDFVVVVVGYYTESKQSREPISLRATETELDILRTFRVLRAVKTISILPGLRMIINALLNAMIQLFEVMLLTLFCLCIFSLFALEIYAGKLHQVCVLIKGSETSMREMERSALHPISPDDPDKHHLYALWVNNRQHWYTREYPRWEYQPCGNETGARKCPEDYICLPNLNDNPDDGWTSFDNIFYSMLSTFQLITLDYWERLYDVVMSTAGPVSILFFIMVVFLGSFYLMNLMLAVVAMSYENEAHTWEQKPLTKHQKLALRRSDSTFSFDDPLKLNVSVMIRYNKRTSFEREQLARTLRNASIVRPTGETGARLAAAGSLTEAVMNMLGRKMSGSAVLNSPPLALGGTMFQPRDYTGELNSRLSIYEDLQVKPKIVPSATASVSVMGDRAKRLTHVPSRISITSENSQEIDTKTCLNVHATLAKRYDKTRNDGKKFYQSRQFFGRMRHRLTPIVTHSSFETFITICIVLNTVLMASEHYGMPTWLEDLIRYGSYAFTVVFVLECIIKLLALQRDYFSQYWNTFDMFVVLISLVDLAVELSLPDKNNNFAFRVVRLLRIFKLAQSWLTMKVLLNIIFSTFGALGNLTLVLAIFIYIFAILGMQIVGGKYVPQNFGAKDPIDEDFPRWNFQTFWHAFMMVFRVLCGEWIEPLWDCLTCHKNQSEWKCFIIFLPILVFGNFVVLNLFLALLLNSFNTEEFNSQRDKEKELSGKVYNLKKVVGMLMMKGERGDDGKAEDDNDLIKKRLSIPTSGHQRRDSGLKLKFKAATHKVILQNRKYCTIRAIRRADEKRGKEEGKPFLKNPMLEPPGETPSKTSQPVEHDDEKDNRLRDCCPTSLTNYNNSCMRFIRNYNLKPWTHSRAFCLKIVVHPSFEWIVLVLILASSVTLCFEDVYLDEKPGLKFVLFILNNVFTGLFVIEMLLKWMAFGLHKYFTHFWTILDVFIVTVSLVTFALDIQQESWLPMPTTPESGATKTTSLQSLKALRTLRALRPLRAISKWQGMKVVVNALLYAIPSIFNVLLVCLLFWLLFAIMGVQFFKGKFYKCVYSESGELVSYNLIEDMIACCSQPDKSWINTTPNFDNVLQGYLSLFQVATFEGWMELMKAATDVPAMIGSNPRREQSYYAMGFFVIFIVFGAFFTLNLFIGVIIDNFNMLKKKYEGNLVEILLTPSQRRYYTAMKKLGRKKPQRVIKRPINKFMALCYDISMSRRFEVFIFAMIFLNMIVMAFEHHGQKKIISQMLEGMNSFFVTIYALEAIVKIGGMRHFYFTFPWNIFDFALVVFSIVADLILSDSEFLPFPPTLLRVLRVFRIGRVLRLIKAAKGIRKLLFALIVSLPALFNIGALLALLTFIYAIVGMALFKDAVLYQPVDEVFSFKTFPKAMLMLFRLMTAAGWNDVLDALTSEEVTCGSYRKLMCGRTDEPECLNPGAGVIYMVSYIILSYLIVINMYIAIILENFLEANQDEEIGIVEDDLEMFYIRWARYDPSATQFINFDQLSEFLACLDAPLHIPRPNIVAIVSFNLPIARGNKIHCLDILHALVKHALGQVDDSDEFRKIQEQMEIKFRKQFPGRKLLDIISSTRIWKIQHNAAVIIQRAWRAYLARTRPPNYFSQKSMESGGQGFGNAFNKIGNFFGSDGRRRLSYQPPPQPPPGAAAQSSRRKSLPPDESERKQRTAKRVSFVQEIQEMNARQQQQLALIQSGGATAATGTSGPTTVTKK